MRRRCIITVAEVLPYRPKLTVKPGAKYGSNMNKKAVRVHIIQNSTFV